MTHILGVSPEKVYPSISHLVNTIYWDNKNNTDGILHQQQQKDIIHKWKNYILLSSVIKFDPIEGSRKNHN